MDDNLGGCFHSSTVSWRYDHVFIHRINLPARLGGGCQSLLPPEPSLFSGSTGWNRFASTEAAVRIAVETLLL